MPKKIEHENKKHKNLEKTVNLWLEFKNRQ